MDVLAKDSGETEGFKAEIKKFENRDLKRKRELVSYECRSEVQPNQSIFLGFGNMLVSVKAAVGLEMMNASAWPFGSKYR